MVLGASGRVVSDVVVAERSRGCAILEEDAHFVAVDLVTDDGSGRAVHIHTRGKATDAVAFVHGCAADGGRCTIVDAHPSTHAARVGDGVVPNRGGRAAADHADAIFVVGEGVAGDDRRAGVAAVDADAHGRGRS